MKTRILIIDDDEKLNQLLHTYLGNMGYEVFSRTDPQEGLISIERDQPHLIILDVMLPKMDGFETCRKIRQQHNTPIIMLTARGETMDRVVGLEMGADDYLPKPFEPRELVARIQAILRRAQNRVVQPQHNFGGLVVDFQKHQVLLDEELISLTTMEFACLSLLIRHAGEVLNRDQILEELRGIEWDAFNRSVDITMSRLRQKLRDDPKQPRFIKTVWGTGYMFIGVESNAA
jgi:DNA-binding response OmpR family regulator